MTEPNTFRAAIRRWTYHNPGRTRAVEVSPEGITFRVFRRGEVRYERSEVVRVVRRRAVFSSSYFAFYNRSGTRLKYLLAPWRPGRAYGVLLDNGWPVAGTGDASSAST